MLLLGLGLLDLGMVNLRVHWFGTDWRLIKYIDGL